MLYVTREDMNDVQTKWLGGRTAETYIAGAVGFKYRDNDGKPQYKKIHYWKTILSNL